MVDTVHSPLTRSNHTQPHYRHGWWWKSLAAGLVLWAVTVVVTIVTANTNLVPTLILLGSFLLPFCVVLFVIERITGNISVLQVFLAFVVGGVSGVLGASLLEASLHPSVGTYIGVGFIEESVKGVILIVVGWRVAPKNRRQGAMLGATVGAGFAAFESAGYAFNAAITAQGIDLVSLLQTEVIRAILAPVGHVLWTAVLGAVIFGAAREGQRFRLSLAALGAFVGVALLHALWDSMGEISSVIALLANGSALLELQYGFLLPQTAETVRSMAAVLYIGGIALTSAVGVTALWRVLRNSGPQRNFFSGPPLAHRKVNTTATTPAQSH
ncbi:PrsW family intramembrane metalloprotease [Leifsonia sp. NPDC014704]|uniref:PrsW family intramembrane metalloprotease n=1 Tax=Leifsonia sp. NPDC014704 TaxID=3364123 RepID=UPI000EB12CF5